MSGEVITLVIETGSNVGSYIQKGVLGSPNSFWLWLWGIVKSVLLWCLSYWYVPIIIIVCYCVILFVYNWLWGYLLSKLQKKG